MENGTLWLPRGITRWLRSLRFFLAVFDLRPVLAAGPALAIESQIGFFDETRMLLYGVGMVSSAFAGLTYQINTEKFTVWSCFGAFLQSGLYGLVLMLIGLESVWLAEHPGYLIGFAILLGLAGPPATRKIQESVPDMIVSFLLAAASRMSKTQTPPKPPDENP